MEKNILNVADSRIINDYKLIPVKLWIKFLKRPNRIDRNEN